MTPDADGHFKGITVPALPWHIECPDTGAAIEPDHRDADDAGCDAGEEHKDGKS